MLETSISCNKEKLGLRQTNLGLQFILRCFYIQKLVAIMFLFNKHKINVAINIFILLLCNYHIFKIFSSLLN